MASNQENNNDSFAVPLPPGKKPRLIAYSKCIICQADKDETLRKAKSSSITTLQKALDLRKDEVYERLGKEICNLASCDVLWHATCYSSYTSSRNLAYATGNHNEGEVRSLDETRRVTRVSAGFSIDWSKCFICGNKT